MSKSEHVISGKDLELYNQEAMRIQSSQSNDKAQLFIKFFSNIDRANQLMKGLFYCNTTSFYRACELEGIGDTQESVSYHGLYEPNAMIGHLRLGEMVESSKFPLEKLDGKMKVHSEKVGFEQGWLHCWFVFDEITGSESLESMLNDLQRVREEFGFNFVSFQAKDLGKVLERINKATNDKVRTSRVGYSDNKMLQNIACKRTDYSYQREFRFIFSECGIEEKEPRAYELGDMSDIFSLNSPISGRLNEKEELFKITKDDIEVDNKIINKRAVNKN